MQGAYGVVLGGSVSRRSLPPLRQVVAMTLFLIGSRFRLTGISGRFRTKNELDVICPGHSELLKSVTPSAAVSIPNPPPLATGIFGSLGSGPLPTEDWISVRRLVSVAYTRSIPMPCGADGCLAPSAPPLRLPLRVAGLEASTWVS